MNSSYLQKNQYDMPDGACLFSHTIFNCSVKKLIQKNTGNYIKEFKLTTQQLVYYAWPCTFSFS